MTRDYIKACEAAGLKYNADFNGETQEGTGVYHTTTKGGIRLSAARAFLRPAMKRRNVTVQTHALVTKLLFDGTRVTGVEYEHGGVLKQAIAAARSSSREVPSTRHNCCN